LILAGEVLVSPLLFKLIETFNSWSLDGPKPVLLLRTKLQHCEDKIPSPAAKFLLRSSLDKSFSRRPECREKEQARLAAITAAAKPALLKLNQQNQL